MRRFERVLKLARGFVEALVRHDAHRGHRDGQPQRVDVGRDHHRQRDVKHQQQHGEHLRVRHGKRRLRQLIRLVEPEHALRQRLVDARQHRGRHAQPLSILRARDDVRLDPAHDQVRAVAV